MPTDNAASAPANADVARALKMLQRTDPAMRVAIKAIGEPVMRRRPGGFPGLIRIIIGQQLSVASSVSIHGRVVERFGDAPEPAAFLAASDETLRACGLSGPKMRYLRSVAASIDEGALDLVAIPGLGDAEAIDALTAVKGIGPWTAAIYLLFCDGRLSIWPPKDVALRTAYASAAELPELPSMAEFDAHAAERFAPTPGVAAHVLWTYYGVLKGRTPV